MVADSPAPGGAGKCGDHRGVVGAELRLGQEKSHAVLVRKPIEFLPQAAVPRNTADTAHGGDGMPFHGALKARQKRIEHGFLVARRNVLQPAVREDFGMILKVIQKGCLEAAETEAQVAVQIPASSPATRC